MRIATPTNKTTREPKTRPVVMIAGPHVGRHGTLICTDDNAAYVVINGRLERVDFLDYRLVK